MANLDFNSEPDDSLGEPDVFDVDSYNKPKPVEKVEPLYRVYAGSRIAVGAAAGKWWNRVFDAASKAYEATWKTWDEVYRYYNNNQNSSLETPRGVFKRGDGTENVVYSNINTVLPAVYSKNPDVTCSTTDQGDQAFSEAMQALLNTLIRRRDKLNAKPKIKRAVGFGLMTNQGVFKLDFVGKDDSRELAAEEMQRITAEMARVKTQEEMSDLYGQFQALESSMELLEPSGVSMKNVLPHNLMIDPNAEQSDGLDGNWMRERCFLPTAMLIAKFTREDPDADNQDNPVRKLVYKPTHKAVFTEGVEGTRDDGLGMVMQAFEESETPTGNTLDERTAFIDLLHTECYYLWDKITRRVMLFHAQDMTWPLWVWDDPLKLTRFFPYFIIAYGMSTGGTTTPGDISYYLDQQDTINDINRQRNKIRRTLFDFFFYNSDAVTSDEAKKFIDAIRGVGTPEGSHLLGVKAGENKITDLVQAFLPPSAQFEHYFDTKREVDAINRITNTNEALRGVQFKTNTNTSAVETYQESMRLSVGAKVDVVEDVVADFAEALAELCVQHYEVEEVVKLIGPSIGQGWKQMPVEEFKASYSLEIAAGSMEKPNSIFKKKEAIEIVQSVGQFAKAAPAASMKIMLKVLEQAFTEVTIKPEDWAAIDAEIAQNMSQQGGTTAAGAGAQQPEDAQKQAMMNLPTEVKARVMQMKQQGASNEQLKAYLMQQLQSNQSKGTVH